MKRTLPEPSPIADQVAKHRSALSPRRQEILSPIFDNPKEFVLLSVRACAERLQTDSAFLLRVVQQLGFASYGDFKKYLHDLSLSNATTYERMQQTGGSSSSLDNVLDASLRGGIENLQALEATLDRARLVALSRRMHAARRILILGGDLSGAVGEYLQYQLTMLGLSPQLLRSTGEMIHAVRSVEKQDVVIGITFRRGLRCTVDALREARQRGAHCAAITNAASSAAARYSDDVFLAGIEGSSLRSTFVAPFALIDVLVAACANVKRRKVLKLMSEASDEQVNGYRWFQD
ncbi:MAG: MurR/RpiR family transcriptional regulator [Acidobacteriaceae bacterium]|nr:MurR/RpiR family transcriptional regulator [Acidobacteriaceae bacterium]